MPAHWGAARPALAAAQGGQTPATQQAVAQAFEQAAGHSLEAALCVGRVPGHCLRRGAGLQGPRLEQSFDAGEGAWQGVGSLGWELARQPAV